MTYATLRITFNLAYETRYLLDMWIIAMYWPLLYAANHTKSIPLYNLILALLILYARQFRRSPRHPFRSSLVAH